MPDFLPEALRAVWLADKPDYPPSIEKFCVGCGKILWTSPRRWTRRDLCPDCQEKRR